MKKILGVMNNKEIGLMFFGLIDIALGGAAKALVVVACIKYLWFSGGGAVG